MASSRATFALRGLPIAALGLLVAACSTSVRTATAPRASYSTPDVESARRRERPPLPVRPITAGAISGKMETAGELTATSTSEGLELTASIGTATPVRCVVYRGERDPGGTLAAVLASAAKTVDIRGVRTDEVVVLGDHAALFVRASYESRGPTRGAGELKAMYYEHPVNPVLCVHDELGYRATFRRITTALAESLRTEGVVLRAPRYAEVRVSRLAGTPIGFARRVVFDGERPGELETKTVVTQALPRSMNELVFEDSVTTETTDATGRILSFEHAKSRGAEIELEVRASRTGPGEYAVTGRRGATPFANRFKTRDKEGLPGYRAIAQQLRDAVVRGRTGPIKVDVYYPAVSPSAPVTTEYDVQPGHRVSVSVGPMRASAEADDNGLLRRVEMPVNAKVVLVDERASSRGSL